ncbi:MAG: hypothetical protein RRA94_01830 [Bacteroidota bacterium]|nr:hypothetical protein [Bacteroidota bacterium]
MSKACLSRLRPSNFLLAAALVLGMSACAGTPTLYDYLTIAPAETQVWNDFMPGSKPSSNAVLRLSVTNASESDVTLSDPEMIITNAPDARALRRFPAVVLVADQRVRKVTIPAKSTVEITFRSPDYGLQPIDTERSPRARLAIRMNSSLDLPLLFRSPIVDIFKTQ